MSADDVLDVLREAVAIVMEVEPASVSRETTFAELDADSLALVEIVEIVEERIAGVRYEDADLDDMVTVGEAVDYAVSRL